MNTIVWSAFNTIFWSDTKFIHVQDWGEAASIHIGQARIVFILF